MKVVVVDKEGKSHIIQGVRVTVYTDDKPVACIGSPQRGEGVWVSLAGDPGFSTLVGNTEVKEIRV